MKPDVMGSQLDIPYKYFNSDQLSRFSMDGVGKTLALGNRTGKVYVWNLDVPDPGDIRLV